MNKQTFKVNIRAQGPVSQSKISLKSKIKPGIVTEQIDILTFGFLHASEFLEIFQTKSGSFSLYSHSSSSGRS